MSTVEEAESAVEKFNRYVSLIRQTFDIFINTIIIVQILNYTRDVNVLRWNTLFLLLQVFFRFIG
jgi:hypothetical protein